MKTFIVLWVPSLLCFACTNDASRRDSIASTAQSKGGNSAVGGSRNEGDAGDATARSNGGVVSIGGSVNTSPIGGASTTTNDSRASGGRSAVGGTAGTTGGNTAVGGAFTSTSAPPATNISCVTGSRPGTTVQTLVFVRHAETMANTCEDACADGACCSKNVCSAGCDNDCNCEENLTNFSPSGWSAIGEPLVNGLKSLDLGWDRIIVSPAWRTQSTIKAYLESESLCGEIVPELEECWNEDAGSCVSPPWESEPYSLLEFAGGVKRLTPRASISSWDPNPTVNPRPSYDHSDGNAACERVILDRAYQYIEQLFSDGAKTVLAVTHAMTGEALLLQLTGSEDYYLKNASAYTVLTRSTGSGYWHVEVNNAK